LAQFWLHPMSAHDLKISRSELLKKKVKFSGYLQKQGGRISTWKRRFLVIFKDCTFAYYTNDTLEDLKGTGSFQQILHIDVEKLVLKIHTPTRIWVFSFENEAGK